VRGCSYLRGLTLRTRGHGFDACLWMLYEAEIRSVEGLDKQGPGTGRASAGRVQRLRDERPAPGTTAPAMRPVRRRAASVGAHVSIQSALGDGTRVRVDLPLRTSDKHVTTEDEEKLVDV
jgi:hypothetical protein